MKKETAEKWQNLEDLALDLFRKVLTGEESPSDYQLSVAREVISWMSDLRVNYNMDGDGKEKDRF